MLIPVLINKTTIALSVVVNLLRLEKDLLLKQVYSQEYGARVEFWGIQLDELWSFVSNKNCQQWVGLL
jgi:hypothetical protein